MRSLAGAERAQVSIGPCSPDRLDGEPALFVNFRPGRVASGRESLGPERLGYRGIQAVFKVRASEAGLGALNLTPHTLRHGLAVDLLEGGADIRTVQDVLGHQSIMTTMVYTRLTNAHLEAGYGQRKSLQKTPSA
jgi:site-specific recombinase XerC